MIESGPASSFHGTTIIGVHRFGRAALGGDGQVTLGQATVIKHHARKVRRLYQGQVLAGFAGTVADAITLLGKFEGRLEEYHGNLTRAAIELTKEWRTDRYLQRLDALLIVADQKNLLIVSGTGEVVEPDDGIAAVGSGGSYALAAARALINHTEMEAADIVKESLLIASGICVYTNDQIVVEEL